jgi:hypothetical protein
MPAFDYGYMVGASAKEGNCGENVLCLGDDYEDRPDLADLPDDEDEFWPPPPSSEHLAMYRVARQRLAALIGMLRCGKLQASGHPVHPGHLPPIMKTIWAHSDFLLDPKQVMFSRLIGNGMVKMGWTG